MAICIAIKFAECILHCSKKIGNFKSKRALGIRSEREYPMRNTAQVAPSPPLQPSFLVGRSCSAADKVCVLGISNPPPPSDHAGGTSPSSFHGTAAATPPSADVIQALVITNTRELKYKFTSPVKCRTRETLTSMGGVGRECPPTRVGAAHHRPHPTCSTSLAVGGDTAMSSLSTMTTHSPGRMWRASRTLMEGGSGGGSPNLETGPGRLHHHPRLGAKSQAPGSVPRAATASPALTLHHKPPQDFWRAG